MKKKLAALLAICMLSVTMTACGGGNAPDETPTAEETIAEEIADEEIADEEIADEEIADEETTDEEITDEETTDEEITDAEPDTNDTTDDSSGFTLLDVTADMIEVGIYAVDEENTQLVFSMFTAPSGTPMASLFVYNPDGSGTVICGPYTTASKTDENGITWTLFTGTDVYTELTFDIGFAQTEDGQVCILNTEGAVYEGEYLTADETVVYMGTAAGLLS